MIRGNVGGSRTNGRHRGRPLRGIFLACLMIWAWPAVAHDFSITETLVLLKSDGTYQVDLHMKLDALALGVGSEVELPELHAALEALPESERITVRTKLLELLQRRVRLRFDEKPVEPDLVLPEHASPTLGQLAFPRSFGTTARFFGRVPPEAKTFSLQLSSAFPPALVTALDQATASSLRVQLQPGERLPALPLGVSLSAAQVATGAVDVVARYLVLGFLHILPKGLDHILFVVGLFLLAARWKPLLWQVSAFTLAHTVSLALATFGVVSVSPRIVEPLIALSIAYVAVENLWNRELKPWRPFVVFGFGLLHGLGFAGVLAELGLPKAEAVPALISFNVGVEAGQLAVLAAAFLLFGVWRERPWYRRAIVVPASVGIAGVGLYWAIERAFG